MTKKCVHLFVEHWFVKHVFKDVRKSNEKAGCK
jgi:hypothetical protein